MSTPYFRGNQGGHQGFDPYIQVGGILMGYVWSLVPPMFGMTCCKTSPGKDSRAFSDLQWLVTEFGNTAGLEPPTRGVNQAEGPTRLRWNKRVRFKHLSWLNSLIVFSLQLLYFSWRTSISCIWAAFFHLLYFKVQNSRTAVELLKKFGGTEYGCAWFEGLKIGDPLVQPTNRR